MYPEVPASFHVAVMNMPNGQALLADANNRALAAAQPRPKPKMSILGHISQGVGMVAGAAKGAAGAVLPDQAEAVLHPLQNASGDVVNALKPGIRAGFTALEMPLQMGTGLARQGYGVATGQQEWEGPMNFLDEARQQTTLGQVIKKWEDGDRVDLGEGFFAGGQVVKDRVKAEQNAAMIGNSAWTAGRWFATDVLQLDQGSTAYNIASGLVDGGVAWYGDPTNWGLVKAAKEGRAARLGTEIVGEAKVLKAAEKADPAWRAVVDEGLGLVKGTYKAPRDSVLVSNTAKWMYGDAGRKVITKMADTDSFYEIWTKTGKKIPAHIVQQIADSSDPAEVANILADAMTSSVRSVPTMGVGKGGTNVVNEVIRSRQAQGRFFNMVPSTRIDYEDIEGSIRNINDSIANAGIHGDLREELVNQAAEMLTTKGPAFQKRFEFNKTWNKILRAQLDAGGMPPGEAEALTRWTNHLDEINYADVDDMAYGIGFDPSKGVGPYMVTQLLHTGSYMYDPEAVRRVREVTVNAKLLHFVANNPGWRLPVSLLAGFQSEVWKPAQLIVPKYLSKILPEERVRLAMGGQIKGPLGWLHTVFGDQYGVNALGEEFQTLASRADDLVEQRELIEEGLKTAKGQNFIDLNQDLQDIEVEFRKLNEDIANKVDDPYSKGMNAGKPNAMYDDSGAERDMQQQIRRGNKQVANADQHPEEWVAGQAESILMMSNDPVAKRVANGGLFPGDDPGGSFRTGTDGIIDWLNMGNGTKFRDAMAETYPNGGAIGRRMVEILESNIMYRTGNDPRLLEAIAKGTVDGESAGRASRVFGNTAGTKLKEALEDARINNQDISKMTLFTPSNVQSVRGSGRDLNRFLEQRDRLTKFWFGSVYGKASDKLNRSPAFQSFYWRRIEELAPHMTKDAADELYDIARGTLPEGQLKRLRGKLDMADGDLDREAVHTYAGHAALDDTTDLLFDASKRTQAFDVLRAIMPFGEAWREVLTSYSRLMVQNPKAIRRFQQTVNGLRGNEILYTNEYGEESVKIPLSGALLNVFTGGAVKTDMSMAAKSLSIGTSVMPGLGPVASIPVYQMIPDEPGTDWLREVLFPYGKPQGGLGLVPLPAWAQKLTEAAGWTDGRTATSTVNQVMNQLATKDPDKYLGDPELLINDAKAVSQGVLIARGIAQMLSPGAPQVRYIAETKDGDVVAMKLSDEFRKLQEDDDKGGEGLSYQEATVEFLEKYGVGAAFYLAGNTEANVKGLDATNNFTNYERDNKWIFDTHSEIAGYFGPHGGEFNYQAYVRQLEAGYRRSLTPNERIAAANQVIGNMMVTQAKSTMPPEAEWGDTERAYLRYVKTEIEKNYKGYTRWGAFDVNESKRQIDDLMETAGDKRLADNETAQLVLQYKVARDDMMARAKAMGRQGFDTSDDTAVMRRYLMYVGESLSKDTQGNATGFATVWDRLLSREVEGEDG